MSKHGLFWTVIWMQALPNISPSWASGSGSQMPSLEEADAGGSGSALSRSVSPSPTTDPASDWESLVNEPDTHQIQSRLQTIAQDRSDPHQWDAIQLLWPSRAQLSESHRTDLSQTLQEIAEDPKHPHYVEAARMFNPPTITIPSPKRHAAGRGGYPKPSFGSTSQRKR